VDCCRKKEGRKEGGEAIVERASRKSKNAGGGWWVVDPAGAFCVRLQIGNKFPQEDRLLLVVVHV
jgi:hypothetical protein